MPITAETAFKELARLVELEEVGTSILLIDQISEVAMWAQFAKELLQEPSQENVCAANACLAVILKHFRKNL